jgi:hypothetical protein
LACRFSSKQTDASTRRLVIGVDVDRMAGDVPEQGVKTVRGMWRAVCMSKYAHRLDVGETLVPAGLLDPANFSRRSTNAMAAAASESLLNMSPGVILAKVVAITAASNSSRRPGGVRRPALLGHPARKRALSTRRSGRAGRCRRG